METKNKRPAELEVGVCTAYFLGMFGYKRLELRELRVKIAPYAQHKAALHVRFIEKGKRSWRGFQEAPSTSLLVLAGHGHPAVRDSMAPVGDGLSVATRWACYAPEWLHDFENTIGPYLANNARVVLADYRGHDTSAGEREAEIRRQGGGPFTAGDRVVTSKGAGVVVYRRMEPPHYREVACYSVRLDGRGPEHVGAMFPAAGVTWEGFAVEAERAAWQAANASSLGAEERLQLLHGTERAAG